MNTTIRSASALAAGLLLCTSAFAEEGEDDEHHILDEVIVAATPLERTVELTPGNYRAWGDLAMMNANQEDQGMGVLDRMIAARPDDGRAYALYGRRIAQLQGNEEAIAYLEDAAQKLVVSSVLPAVRKMRDGFKDEDNSYRGVIEAALCVLDRHMELAGASHE